MTTNTFVPNPISPRIYGHRRSAIADQLQSATGIMLGCFLLVHLHFESSILLGKDAFYHVVQLLEGGMFSATGHGYPWTTQVISIIMLVVLMIHALTALRRFPTQLGQWRALRKQQRIIKHSDSQLWFWQLVTGFGLFFLAPVHLYDMLTDPSIGPNLSAERVYHGGLWMLYVLLLPMVVVHALFGLYRVLLKWGWVTQRTALRKMTLAAIIYLLVLGSASLLVYFNIGSELTLPVSPYIPS